MLPQPDFLPCLRTCTTVLRPLSQILRNQLLYCPPPVSDIAVLSLSPLDRRHRNRNSGWRVRLFMQCFGLGDHRRISRNVQCLRPFTQEHLSHQNRQSRIHTHTPHLSHHSPNQRTSNSKAHTYRRPAQNPFIILHDPCLFRNSHHKPK